MHLRAELNHPESEFYLARKDDGVIGYLKLNWGTAQTEVQDDPSLEIERIYVAKSFQGQSVDQLLYEKALDRARELPVAFIWLGVWKKNQRAIRFYEKNGFEPFGQHVFVLGKDRQIDVMMRKAI